ncbi:homeobox protein LUMINIDEPENDENS-like [Forsythia ovata]|uniref:Homeobox protein LUMINIDEPENDENS-like n=1 Tax=Forsythia ovata TaxID=205694 RepID=A0ABD1VD87_9LAMI
MELPKEENELVELAVTTSSATSYQDLLQAQLGLFESQIERLENIVTTQCELTGVNPLSQEMAAGSLSIKIGKRPRDLLNPKAIKYMQSVFALKDTISKKETREISSLFRITATQVRDFFNSQRSRVRKFVRLSREKANRSTSCNEMHDEVPSTSSPNMPIEPVPIHIVVPTNIEEGPSCSTQVEVLSHVDDLDRHFVDNIFSLMRKEELFSGQVKLMEWILQIQNPSVLYWFLTNGGVMILATWLSQAASEEQTSVLNVVLKVLCHLPLQRALPVHMSAILQGVNKLRFYRKSDISNRARMLLARWSKAFAKSQALKKRNGMNSAADAQDEMLLKQSIDEVMCNEARDSKVDNSGNALIPFDNQDNLRKLGPSHPLKMITASIDDSNKRRGVLSSQGQKRRKVQMVEQPVQRTGTRNPQVAKSVPATQSRPLSADDIQKAKMRAQFMQNKYGKSITSSEESQKKCTSSQASPSVPNAFVRPKLEEQKKLDLASSEVATQQETPRDITVNLDSDPPWKKCKNVQIPWQTPPEVKISDSWHVGIGENSKEVEVQKNRARREREVVYRTIQEIPPDPREPWDREMDFDDLLTPEIPIEQMPDVEPLEAPVSAVESQEVAALVASTSSQNVGGSGMPEPDLELLAELLKNPQLVFALTSGQAGELSSGETVKLLDLIKANGVNSLSSLAALGTKADNKVEVSLPSPTPSSDPVTGGLKPDFSRNPFSRLHTVANGNAHKDPGVGQTHPASSLNQPQIPATLVLTPQLSAGGVQQLVHQHQVVPPVSSFQTASQQWHPPITPANTKLASEMRLNTNNLANSTLAIPNVLDGASRATRVKTLGNVQPLPGSIMSTLTERQIGRPSSGIVQPHQPKLAQVSYGTEPVVSNSWRVRPGLEPEPHYQEIPRSNNYNAYTGGPLQTLDARERNHLAEAPKFETWSPENSPMRSHEYVVGRNQPQPIMNSRHGYRPERAMLQNSVQPSGYRDHGRGGNRGWRGGRR